MELSCTSLLELLSFLNSWPANKMSEGENVSEADKSRHCSNSPQVLPDLPTGQVPDQHGPHLLIHVGGV